MAEELVCLGNLRLTPEDHPRKEMHLVLLSQYLEAQHRALPQFDCGQKPIGWTGWHRLCAFSLPDRLLSVSHTLLYGTLTLTLEVGIMIIPFITEKKKHCGEVNVPKGANDRLGLHPGSSISQILGAESTTNCPWCGRWCLGWCFFVLLHWISFFHLLQVQDLWATCYTSRPWDRSLQFNHTSRTKTAHIQQSIKSPKTAIRKNKVTRKKGDWETLPWASWFTL